MAMHQPQFKFVNPLHLEQLMKMPPRHLELYQPLWMLSRSIALERSVGHKTTFLLGFGVTTLQVQQDTRNDIFLGFGITPRSEYSHPRIGSRTMGKANALHLTNRTEGFVQIP